MMRRFGKWLFFGSIGVAAILGVDIGPFGLANVVLLAYAFLGLNVAFTLSGDTFIR